MCALYLKHIVNDLNHYAQHIWGLMRKLLAASGKSTVCQNNNRYVTTCKLQNLSDSISWRGFLVLTEVP